MDFNLPPEQPKKAWFSSHMILGIVFLIAVFAAFVSVLYYWQTVRSIPSTYEQVVHKDPTSNWKIYSNEQYGYSFAYDQNNFDVQQVKTQTGANDLGDSSLKQVNEVSVNYKDDGPWWYDVNVYENNQNKTIDQVFQSLIKFFSPNQYSEYKISDIHLSDIKVAGLAAKKMVIDNYGDHGNSRAVFIKGSFVYEIGGTDDMNGNDLDKFISTFKFTDSTQIISDELISYKPNSALFTVTKEQVKISKLFNAKDLVNNAQGCNLNKDESYYDLILTKHGLSDTATQYSFTHVNSENVKYARDFQVTVLSNKAEYKDLKSFQADFGVCEAGGDLYPQMFSNQYLLFVNSCGTGFGDQAEINCDDVRSFVEPSLKLND